MASSNQRFFLSFSRHWPHFLKNNAMLNLLINMGRQSSTLAKQQSEIIHILTRKNVLHPELLEAHLDTFMKMKDRERVAEYLEEYLHAASTLGYTSINATDMQKLAQLFRRLHKTPDQVPMSLLLNFLVVLCLQKRDVYYRDFDIKSVEFIEGAIDLVEKHFTGQETIEVPLPDPITGEIPKDSASAEKIKLNYFKSIES